jgi:hypothetical protein
MIEDEEWKDMLAEYGDFYFAPEEEKSRRAPLIEANKGFSFPYMAAAMGAYAARYYGNAELAKKIWRTLKENLAKGSGVSGFKARVIKSYVNTDQLTEIPWISTNFTAQWCLNVIICLELIKDYLPQEL